MENQEIKWQQNVSFSYTLGDWSVECYYKRFKFNNKGIKLVAKGDEGLKKVIFNTERKTVAVVVTTPTLPVNVPRIADLSDSPKFFEEVRNNIETILTTGTYNKVTPNEDRTVFVVE